MNAQEREDMESYNYFSMVDKYTDAGKTLYATQILEKAVNTIEALVQNEINLGKKSEALRAEVKSQS